MVQAGWGVERVKSSPSPPPLRSWGPFSTQTTKYCNLSLAEFNENKHFICFRGSMLGLQWLNLSLRGSILYSRGPILRPRGAPRNQRGRGQQQVFILGMEPTGPRALPWLISPHSPELWMHSCLQKRHCYSVKK